MKENLYYFTSKAGWLVTDIEAHAQWEEVKLGFMPPGLESIVKEGKSVVALYASSHDKALLIKDFAELLCDQEIFIHPTELA